MATVNLPTSAPATTSVRYTIAIGSGGNWSDAFAGINYNALPGAPTTEMYMEVSASSFVQNTLQLIVVDTSTIPVGATITAASFTMTSISGGGLVQNSPSFVLIPTTLTSLTSTAQALRSNWTVGTNMGSTLMAPFAAPSFTGTITLNAAGIANINKGGTTYIGMTTDNYISQTIPGGVNSIELYSQTGTTPPFLTVTYTLGSPSGFFFAAAR